MQNPVLHLAFSSEEDAEKASWQHICLCRNEDVMFPGSDIIEMTEEEFNAIHGFELRFGESERSFLVGYNRYGDNKPMYGWIEYDGQSLL